MSSDGARGRSLMGIGIRILVILSPVVAASASVPSPLQDVVNNVSALVSQLSALRDAAGRHESGVVLPGGAAELELNVNCLSWQLMGCGRVGRRSSCLKSRQAGDTVSGIPCMWCGGGQCGKKGSDAVLCTAFGGAVDQLNSSGTAAWEVAACTSQGWRRPISIRLPSTPIGPEHTSTRVPTAEPTAVPTVEPTATPTVQPTMQPTAQPSVEPMPTPTAGATLAPAPTALLPLVERITHGAATAEAEALGDSGTSSAAPEEGMAAPLFRGVLRVAPGGDDPTKVVATEDHEPNETQVRLGNESSTSDPRALVQKETAGALHFRWQTALVSGTVCGCGALGGLLLMCNGRYLRGRKSRSCNQMDDVSAPLRESSDVEQRDVYATSPSSEGLRRELEKRHPARRPPGALGPATAGAVHAPQGRYQPQLVHIKMHRSPSASNAAMSPRQHLLQVSPGSLSASPMQGVSVVQGGASPRSTHAACTAKASAQSVQSPRPLAMCSLEEIAAAAEAAIKSERVTTSPIPTNSEYREPLRSMSLIADHPSPRFHSGVISH